MGQQFWLIAAAVFVSMLFVVLVVGYVAGGSYGDASRARASAEANSYAEHSGWLATGDAFGGYIQLLRYADDPEIRSSLTPSDIRTAAMRRVLELNTNRFSGLAVLSLDGQVLAATDGTMLDALSGDAFATVRANQGNANSDIVLPESGGSGYVEYATILVDPSGQKWAVLIARGAPDRLWLSTLAASIDGGRNVIINQQGQLAAGVPPEDLGRSWSGSDFGDGAIRTTVGGVDSICGLAAIASNTQIDHGWNVGSCLPASIVIASSGIGSRAILAGLFASAVGAAAVATLVYFLGQRSPVERELEPAVEEMDETLLPESEPQPIPVPPPNVDARTLIEAYELRSARLAGRVRDTVQARLLVASSRVDEALQLQEEDPALARVMLERASHELEDLNEHELRAMGQDLYPDLIRLGLPAALRALSKDLAGSMEIALVAEADSDSLDDESERAIEPEVRLVLYRFAREALRHFDEAGMAECSVHLEQSGGDLWLAVKGHGDPGTLDPALFRATELAAETYGGIFRLDIAHESVEAVVEFESGAPESAVEVEPEVPISGESEAGDGDQIQIEAA
jgi:hypothetical protein